MYAEPTTEDSKGDFKLPKARGTNRKRQGAGSHFDFSFNGLETRLIPRIPDSCQMHKEYSIYYGDGRFWIVNYDATINVVGDGDEDGSTIPEDVNMHSEDDSDATGEDPDDTPSCDDWRKLSFDSVPESTIPLLSRAGRRQPRKHLLTQHRDQAWAVQILPDAFQARPRNWTTTRGNGGLVGDLPLLIGLMAMSVPTADVGARIPYMIQSGSWRACPPLQVPRCAGWDDGRGMVVKVFHDGQRVSRQAIERYENGELGPILR